MNDFFFNNDEQPIARIAAQAPNFKASAVMGDNSINDSFELHKVIEGKKAILFFYPLDFTFVCPSEIIAFNNKIDEFKQRNVEVIAVSVDSKFTHLAYKNTETAKGGIGNIQYPLVADLNKAISDMYGVLDHESGVAYRGLFLIDEDKKIRHMLINDLPLGRNVDEALRMIDALAFHQEHGEVCPANWNKGKSGMKANPEGVAAYLSAEASNL